MSTFKYVNILSIWMLFFFRARSFRNWKQNKRCGVTVAHRVKVNKIDVLLDQFRCVVPLLDACIQLLFISSCHSSPFDHNKSRSQQYCWASVQCGVRWFDAIFRIQYELCISWLYYVWTIVWQVLRSALWFLECWLYRLAFKWHESEIHFST